MINFDRGSILNDASYVRGWIISDTVLIERMIDDIFSQYFCKTQKLQKEFKEMFMSTERITFEMKRQAFKFFTKKHHPELEKEYPKLYTYLQTAMEERNIFAHYIIDISKESKKRYPKEIGFVKYKHETKTIWYNEDQINAHIEKLSYCIKAIKSLYGE